MPTDDCEVEDGVPGLGRPEVDPAPVRARVVALHAVDAQGGGRGERVERGPDAQANRGRLAPQGGVARAASVVSASERRRSATVTSSIATMNKLFYVFIAL